MFRLALAFSCVLSCALVSSSADPQTPRIERQLAVQTAMASARKQLDAQMPGEAIATLEKELENADGNKAFLNLLREAYLAELYKLEKSPNTDPDRLAKTRRRLLLVGGQPPKPTDPPKPVDVPKPPVDVPKPPATLPEPNLGPSPVLPGVAPPDTPSVSIQPPAKSPVGDAVTQFKQGHYVEADRLFAAVGASKLTAEQRTAWAYCRIKSAADRVNAPNCDAATAAAAVQSVGEALELITDNAKVLGFGREVLKAAQAKAGNAKTTTPVVASGDAIETPSFRIHHGGNRELGAAVAKAAEASRKQIFERWSGPPGGAWQPKCEIVIHTSASAYARATGKPVELTGHASVRLNDGRATERRIDLRADDDSLMTNALPRELSHVVLADLFGKEPPPRWALEGMAILACSPEEIDRYTRTLTRCAREGELRTLAALFNLKDVPADKLTGYYCQSVSVTAYLIKLNGERNFKIFLGAALRYDVASALKQQYGIDGPQALEQVWKRACLDQARGQAP